MDYSAYWFSSVIFLIGLGAGIYFWLSDRTGVFATSNAKKLAAILLVTNVLSLAVVYAFRPNLTSIAAAGTRMQNIQADELASVSYNWWRYEDGKYIGEQIIHVSQADSLQQLCSLLNQMESVDGEGLSRRSRAELVFEFKDAQSISLRIARDKKKLGRFWVAHDGWKTGCYQSDAFVELLDEWGGYWEAKLGLVESI